MRRYRVLLIGAGLGIALTVLAVLASDGNPSADGSSLSAGAHGWLAARRYLEARGTEVVLLDRALEGTRPSRGPLVLVFPWQRFTTLEGPDAVKGHLHEGGTVVLAYSGATFAEMAMRAALGLGTVDARGRPPLHPLRWRRFAAQEWSLQPERAANGAAPLHMRAPIQLPKPPGDATVLYRTPQGLPAVFVYARGRGRVVALPAEVLSNARIAQDGNVDLLETLRRSVPGVWTFDEFHHGLLAPADAAAGSRRSFDLYVLHLVFLYLLTVFAAIRRFGPAWSEPPVIAASTGAFLVGLGGLHHRLGHHREGARQLVDRARELDPRLPIPSATEEAAARADSRAFLSLARSIGRSQRHARRDG